MRTLRDGTPTEPNVAHATRDDNSGKTMCGRLAIAVRIDDGFPNCLCCIASIAKRMRDKPCN